MYTSLHMLSFFFFNDTATTEIYTLSLHDALPISMASACISRLRRRSSTRRQTPARCMTIRSWGSQAASMKRSEEHTSELQSRQYLVCRLLLEKKKNTNIIITTLFYYTCIFSTTAI